MEKYVLDTNLFFNMQADMSMGKTTKEVVAFITSIGEELKKKKMGEFFMPPSIVEEFLGFFENRKEPFLKNFLSVVTVQSPNYHSLSFPGSVFYRLVEDVRSRSYRGLRAAEEEIEHAGRLMEGSQDLDKKNFQIKIGEVVRGFRQRYRTATRVGFLDSGADLDLIALSKEVSGFLISADEGVMVWARAFGVKEMPPSVWRSRMELHLRE